MPERLERRMRSAVHRYRHPRPQVRVGTGPGTGTVYFLVPDWVKPSGGVRVMYRHADLLRAAGLDAVVLHQKKGFRVSWFPNTTIVSDVGSVVLGASDTLVVGELDVDVIAKLTRPVRHVVLNQSGHLTWLNGDPRLLAAHYRTDPGLLGVIAVSEHSLDLLTHAFPNLPVRRVHLSLDRRVFHLPASDDGAARERTVAYLPRRGAAETEQVLGILRSRGVFGPEGALAAWRIRPLSGLSQPDLASAMREASVVLTTSYQEGFGLPAAEAMACGAYVVGFTGFGGAEFFDPSYSSPCPAGDVLAVARALEDVLLRETAAPGWTDERGRLASAAVLGTYSPEHEREDVLAAYRELVVPETQNQAATSR